jgi:hypothetical protein
MDEPSTRRSHLEPQLPGAAKRFLDLVDRFRRRSWSRFVDSSGSTRRKIQSKPSRVPSRSPDTILDHHGS